MGTPVNILICDDLPKPAAYFRRAIVLISIYAQWGAQVTLALRQDIDAQGKDFKCKTPLTIPRLRMCLGFC